MKLQSACFEKLIFSHVFNVRETKGTAKFDGLEPRRCEDIKGIVASKVDPKGFGTSKKRAPGGRFSKVPRTFRTRKAIRKTTICLFCKAGLLICCKGNKIKITAKFHASRLLRFEDTKRIMSPEKFRDFRETGPRGPFLERPETFRVT